jgi:chorismate dehydratase
MAKVLLVNNLSAEPYRLIKPAFASEVRELPPSQTWLAAQQNHTDMALISVARRSDVAGVMEPLGHFGVACFGAVGSVVCVSKQNLAQVARDRLPVHLTVESETSVLLFQHLWRKEFGIAPTIAADASQAAARLCIGNEARALQVAGQWPLVTDLGEWWYRQTGLPFVFARWMIRTSCSSDVKQRAHDWLAESTALARTAEGGQRMVRRTLEQRLFNTPTAAAAYFAALVSRFTHAEVQAEAQFLELIRPAK